MKKIIAPLAVTVITAATLLSAVTANAAPTANSQLTQQINPGVLSTDIRDAGGAVVAAPSFAMGAVTVSTSVQTSTGVFGTNTQRITVDNPSAGGAGGWTLTFNAATPGTGTWSNGTNSYAYNGTAATGQLTVNAAAGTLTPTAPGTATGITKGASATFTGSTPITLLNAGASADKIWNGYLTGVALSQTIPANTPTGTYTINMVQTVATQ